MTRTLTLSATEPQAKFHQLTCKYPLFVAGFGAGKSETMLNQALMDVSCSSDAVVALYAPTYDLVSLIIASRMCAKLDEHKILHVYNKATQVINILEPGFGCFIMRTLNKPERIIGYESYRAHVDELDTLPKEQAALAWEKIIARNRQSPKGVDEPFNRVSAYTTPEGYRFAYDRWVKRGDTELYQRVHAKTESNPFLPEGYVDALRASYPPELIDAYLNGQFVNLSGGNVYSSYDRHAHNSTECIRENEPLFIGMDFNITKMAATIYVKRKGGKEWHAVDEIVDAYDTADVISILQSRYPKNVITIYPDASGGSRKTSAPLSDVAMLEGAGYKIRVRNRTKVTIGSNPDVKDRVNAMNAALSHGKVYINHDKCPTTAECLEQQPYDKNSEPCKKSGNDHQNDATTYPIAYTFPIRRPVANIDVKMFTHT